MGKQTRFFKQSKRSITGSKSASNYAQINRIPWHMKLVNFIKVRGKGGQNVQG